MKKHEKVSRSQKCLTYLWQEKALGVLFYQVVLSAEIDSDTDLLALLGVGAVLPVHTQDLVSDVIHWTREGTLAWGARPVSSAGIRRTLGGVVNRSAAWYRGTWLKSKWSLVFKVNVIRRHEHCKTQNISAVNVPLSTDKCYFANATSVPGPRAGELSTEILSSAL